MEDKNIILEKKLEEIYEFWKEQNNTTEDFYKFCDNKGNTLILIETMERRKFGGFIHNNWKDNNNYWMNNYK